MYEGYSNKSSIIYTVLLLFMPIILLSDLFNISDKNLLTGIKVFLFVLAMLLIPLKRWLPRRKYYLYIYIFILYLVFLTISLRTSNDDLIYVVLYVLPFFLFFLEDKIIFKMSSFLVKYFSIIIVMAFLFVISSPKILFAGREIFVPLLHGPHTSVYSITILYLYIFLGYLNKVISKKIFIVISLLSLFIIFGYKARNAELGIIFFFLTFYFYESQWSKSSKNIFIYFIVILLTITLYFLNQFWNIDWNTFSSGRLFAWKERIDILSNYDLLTLLFGSGYGADIMKTKQWWWEAKASHNDFLSIIFNGGLFSLFGLLLIGYKLFVKANSFQKGLIIYILITSATNTGLLGRPIQFLYIVLLYIVANSISKVENAK